MNKSIAFILLLASITIGSNIVMPTRFGTLSSNDDNVLLMNSKKVSPDVEGNSFLRTVALFQIGESDVVILENIGGSACPSLLRILTVSNEGVKTTDEFGSCTDIYTISFADDVIKISMSGFSGPFESEKAAVLSARKRHTFTFKNGILKESIK